MKLQNKSKLQEIYKVGYTVKDIKFSGLTGVIIKVTARSITVKHNKSTGKYVSPGTDTLEIIPPICSPKTH